MKKTFGLALAAAAALVATPAFAADFTGPRVGVNAGYENVDGEDLSVGGIAYGLNVGYDVALGPVIAGVTAEVSDSTSDVDLLAGGATVGELSTGRELSAMVRLGTKVTDRTLVYVLGGYTNAKVTAKAAEALGGFKISENGDGYRVGAGLEYAINDHVYANAEYRYSDYEGDLSTHRALVGMGFRF